MNRVSHRLCNIAYLSYGPQSGVITFFSSALSRRGVNVEVRDASTGFSFRMRKIKFPSLYPRDLLNSVLSIKKYGARWKEGFYRTELAFYTMSRKSYTYIRGINPSVVLQSGALFNPFRFWKKDWPYVLYLDHTYALTKHHPKYLPEDDVIFVTEKLEQEEKEVYKMADLIFVMSHNVRRSLVEYYGIDENKIFVIGAGPNLHKIPDKVDKEFFKEGKRILFVGKDFRRKGGEVLLNAFKRLKVMFSDVELVVVGYDGRGYREIDGVNFVGQVGFEEMSTYYKNADLFVMPTLKEPFGLAYLEAMAYGLPCIGTKIEAVPEIIEDGKTGLLVDPLDEDGLFNAMRYLLTHPDEARMMGMRGYEKVRNYFNWDATAERFIQRVEVFFDENSY